MQLALKNPDCLCMEYDIVQHALYDNDGDNGLANFGVCYDDSYKLEYVSIHPYGTISTGTEIYVLRKVDDVLMCSETYSNFKPATSEELQFFNEFEQYFTQAVADWLN